jgi:signal transduction histidine kinase
MKGIYTSRPLRLIAYLLGGLMLVVTAISGALSVYLAMHGAYGQKPVSNEALYCSSESYRQKLSFTASNGLNCYYAVNVFIPDRKNEGKSVDSDWEKAMRDEFEALQTHLDRTVSVTLYNHAGQLVFSNQLDLPVLYSQTFSNLPECLTIYESDEHTNSEYPITIYTARIDVHQIYDPADEYQSFKFLFYSTLNRIRILLLILPFAGVIIFLLCMIFLMRGAGLRADRTEIVLTWYDKIPVGISFLVHLGLLILVAAPAAGYGREYLDLYWGGDLNYFAIIWIAAGLWLAAMLMMSFLSSFSARVKAGKWWRNSLVYNLLHLAGRLLQNLPIIWKGLLVMIVLLILDPLLISGRVWIWCLFRLSLMAFACVLLIQLDRLKTAGQQLAIGKLDHQINEKDLFGDIRKHAEHLNSIQSVIGQAVEERMKSERFKTELITNVSHDIRTPLTSIINYVDLLKKLPIEDPTARGYIEVIDRQASRLKKLSDDVIDASKAATGNIEVKMQETNLNELIAQITEEYAERLAASELTPVIRTPAGPCLVMTDGRLLWRIMDNLFQNICKYALPGTRVYVDLNREEKGAGILLRNVSRTPLNQDGEVLLERFVQGDPSRSTEGSGLGLSIAQSLAGLIGGSLELQADGDLFKIILHLP